MEQNLKPLEWFTEKRIIKDLIPYEFNPRKITEEKRQKLLESLEKFNLVEIPVLDFDDIIIAGHQRIEVLLHSGKGNLEIDVRVPNRKLTEKELKEYNLRSNISSGQFDFDMIINEFEDISLDEIGLLNQDLDSMTDMINETTKEDLKPEKKELKAFKKTHVLLSFPPDKILEVETALKDLITKDFIEYEQSSN
jgi:ParB-like chromosome segregation protein Spo0J